MKNEENRGFFGILIPAEIVDSTDLSVSEKFVYGFIASFNKACFLSNEALADRTGVSKETVSRAINRLARMGYIYVELVNGNNAARRIYSVYDNPKKLKYLASKGMFNINREDKASFPQSSQNDVIVEKSGKSFPHSRQNDAESSQNDESPNRGESSQNDDHRYRIKEEESASPAGFVKSSGRPRRKDYQTKEEWEQAFYAYSEVVSK